MRCLPPPRGPAPFRLVGYDDVQHTNIAVSIAVGAVAGYSDGSESSVLLTVTRLEAGRPGVEIRLPRSVARELAATILHRAGDSDAPR